MFCTECSCEFVGIGINKCPNCRSTLTDLTPSAVAGDSLTYDELLSLVGDQGGQLAIDLSASSVIMARTWRFPYFGYGFAHTREMQGSPQGVPITLETTDVERQNRSTFLWRGYGFEWPKEVTGTIGGNSLILRPTRVERQRKYVFPYFGYGYAWASTMTGECGPKLSASLATTHVGRYKAYNFPWRGYGYAWERKGILTLTLP